jgi:phi13 family phage major tail protein
MSVTENKVKYGLDKVYYAVATLASDGTATFAAPKPFPGAVDLSMDSSSSLEKFWADNMPYYLYNTESGIYSGTLEMAYLPSDFRKDCLGELEDAYGRLYADTDAELPHFALLFQFKGDQHGIRHVLYNCVASQPSIASHTTEGSNEPQTESVDITANPVYFAGVDKNVTKMRAYEGDTGYSTWYTSVVTPAASTT